MSDEDKLDADMTKYLLKNAFTELKTMRWTRDLMNVYVNETSIDCQYWQDS